MYPVSFVETIGTHMTPTPIEIRDTKRATRLETNFGFVLLVGEHWPECLDPEDEIEAEVYGQVGIGRYELIAAGTVYADKDQLTGNIDALIDDNGQGDNIENICIPTKRALEGLWKNPWVLDNRVRCVAVYRGPRQDCLNGIDQQERCVFFRSWSEHTEREQPDVPERIRGEAKRVYDALRLA